MIRQYCFAGLCKHLNTNAIAEIHFVCTIYPLEGKPRPVNIRLLNLNGRLMTPMDMAPLI